MHFGFWVVASRDTPREEEEREEEEGWERREKRGPGRSPGKKWKLPYFQASWGALVTVSGLSVNRVTEWWSFSQIGHPQGEFRIFAQRPWVACDLCLHLFFWVPIGKKTWNSPGRRESLRWPDPNFTLVWTELFKRPHSSRQPFQKPLKTSGILSCLHEFKKKPCKSISK